MYRHYMVQNYASILIYYRIITACSSHPASQTTENNRVIVSITHQLTHTDANHRDNAKQRQHYCLVNAQVFDVTVHDLTYYMSQTVYGQRGINCCICYIL